VGEKDERSLICGSWVEIEPATVEVDCQLETLTIPEAARRVLDPLDLRVQALRHGVRDPMVDVVEDILEVAANDAGDVKTLPGSSQSCIAYSMIDA
jgi:hypothetical protein